MKSPIKILALAGLILAVVASSTAFAATWNGADKSTVTNNNPSVTFQQTITQSLNIPINDAGYWSNYYRHQDPYNQDYYNPGFANVDARGPNYATQGKWSTKLYYSSSYSSALTGNTRVFTQSAGSSTDTVTHVYIYPGHETDPSYYNGPSGMTTQPYTVG